jgi:hypothetical protein
MAETLIGFTNEEIDFATSLVKFARTKLQEQHDETHSGVDQLLINGWIISTDELLTKFEARGVKHIEVYTSDLVQPEA